jgi:hypothetical protein
MRKTLLVLLLALHSAVKISAQCIETEQPRILLAGDSWAFFMNTDRTFNNVFKKWGFSNYTFVSNTVLSENGADTHDFLTATKLNEIKSQLHQNPSIEVVHLSIGGNDVLGDWKVSWPQSKTDSLKSAVEQRLRTIIDSIKSFKPNIHIVWNGYTYPNFEEVIKDFFFPTQHPFYSTWQKMEFPTFQQINTILNDFSATFENYAATDPRVHFVNATGILQYTFGQTVPLGVAPGGTYPPFSVPLPAGKPDYPSPKNSMRDYFGIAKDCYHLSPQGYEDLIDYQFQKFYHKFFMDDFYVLSESGNACGAVSSEGNVSAELKLGEWGGAKFATVLSFNLANMYDTTVTAASIFLRRENMDGSAPDVGTLQVRIKNGNMGATAYVDAADYADNGNASAVACVFGSAAANGHWIRIDLPPSLLPHIRSNTVVQFIITTTAPANGVVYFNNSSVAEYAPVLNITYGETPYSFVQDVVDNQQLHVYPNPSANFINIDNQAAKIIRWYLTDMPGKIIMQNETLESPLDISALTPGIYNFCGITTSGVVSKKLIKQ